MAPWYKVAYVVWPRKLAVRTDNGLQFIGWVCLQKARLIRNHHYGWIAAVDDQTPDKLAICPSCKRPLKEH